MVQWSMHFDLHEDDVLCVLHCCHWRCILRGRQRLSRKVPNVSLYYNPAILNIGTEEPVCANSFVFSQDVITVKSVIHANQQ